MLIKMLLGSVTHVGRGFVISVHNALAASSTVYHVLMQGVTGHLLEDNRLEWKLNRCQPGISLAPLG
jgi:hypothetical protein